MSDLGQQALAFAEFIEDTIKEAVADPGSMPACLVEAEAALRCLEKTLTKLDGLAYAQFIISPLNRFQFVPLSEDTEEERRRLLNMVLGSIETLKVFLG